MTAPFLIYSLPRSRTFWLSKFLSYGGWECGHDEIRRMRSLDDVRAWLNTPGFGSVETAAAPWWRLAQEIRPDLRVTVIRRPVNEVVDSLMATGVRFDLPVLWRAMQRLDAKLDQIERRVVGVRSVQFADLVHEGTCADLFEDCLSLPHDPTWWARADAIEMTIDFPASVRYYEAHADQLARFARSARQHILAKMTARPVVTDGMVLTQEPFEDFLRDGKRLFAEHLVQVGEPPDAFTAKNLPLMRRLDEIGALQITTARANGRMFGYSMVVLGVSLEDGARTEAHHTTFYVSKDAPGLGLKLQRASVDALRARGVDQAYFRAGTRGSGPRMGALYRRLGAETAGELFCMNLGRA